MTDERAAISLAETHHLPNQRKLIEMLENALQEVKSGKLNGVFLIMLRAGEWQTLYELGPTRTTSLLGYLQIAQHQIVQYYLDNE